MAKRLKHKIANIELSKLVSLLGKIFVFLYFFSICYHFCNGIRHLTWDLGYGFEIKNVYITGYITIFCALLMNILLWTF